MMIIIAVSCGKENAHYHPGILTVAYVLSSKKLLVTFYEVIPHVHDSFLSLVGRAQIKLCTSVI